MCSTCRCSVWCYDAHSTVPSSYCRRPRSIVAAIFHDLARDFGAALLELASAPGFDPRRGPPGTGAIPQRLFRRLVATTTLRDEDVAFIATHLATIGESPGPAA